MYMFEYLLYIFEDQMTMFGYFKISDNYNLISSFLVHKNWTGLVLLTPTVDVKTTRIRSRVNGVLISVHSYGAVLFFQICYPHCRTSLQC